MHGRFYLVPRVAVSSRIVDVLGETRLEHKDPPPRAHPSSTFLPLDNDVNTLVGESFFVIGV